MVSGYPLTCSHGKFVRSKSLVGFDHASTTMANTLACHCDRCAERTLEILDLVSDLLYILHCHTRHLQEPELLESRTVLLQSE